jgi:hypothetical protein
MHLDPVSRATVKPPAAVDIVVGNGEPSIIRVHVGHHSGPNIFDSHDGVFQPARALWQRVHHPDLLHAPLEAQSHVAQMSRQPVIRQHVLAMCVLCGAVQ